jgi:hypothetical protein
MLTRTLLLLPLVAGLLATVHAEERKPAAENMPRSMSESEIALHALMEPIWRAPKGEGPARACANPGAIQARVDAAVGEKGTAPFLGMSKTANELNQACREKRMQDVGKLLGDLHHQFHKMVGME